MSVQGGESYIRFQWCPPSASWPHHSWFRSSQQLHLFPQRATCSATHHTSPPWWHSWHCLCVPCLLSPPTWCQQTWTRFCPCDRVWHKLTSLLLQNYLCSHLTGWREIFSDSDGVSLHLCNMVHKLFLLLISICWWQTFFLVFIQTGKIKHQINSIIIQNRSNIASYSFFHYGTV